ncbi:MAG: glycosyltransferase [Anaerolineae bacterium]|nr:glycosyltransferase [Anaerolineae bacterium]
MLPQISVVMSVYNGERYLREAIDSILNQTFGDFEFIIINDCSTDGTAAILDSYDDARIVQLNNKQNLGLSVSLNRGLDIASGEYIARMDADDISLPERFSRQLAFMNEHPHCTVVATRMALVDGDGCFIRYAPEDMQSITWEEIQSTMPRINCIGHPTVMMRTMVIKDYRYRKTAHSQDYDLWLRLCSDGKIICKLDEILLHYRVHSTSITSLSRINNPLKTSKVRTNYLFYQLTHLHLTCFELNVLKYMLLDIKTFLRHRVKTSLKSIGKPLFHVLALLIAYFLERKYRSSLYFFFPHWSMGGAEKVHAAIVSCLDDQKPYVFFERQPLNNLCKPLFPDEAVLVDLGWVFIPSRYLLACLCVRVLAEIINMQPGSVVFGSNSHLFYRLIPHLKSSINTIDLIHAFGTKDFPASENTSFPHIRRLNHRVAINIQTFNDIHEQYILNGADLALLDRIMIIENKVDIPNDYTEKPLSGSLEIVYVGRGSPEKRIHLIEEVAHRCHMIGLPVHFTFVGDVDAWLKKQKHPNCTFSGLIGEADTLHSFYREAHLLIMASNKEGFPLAVMEAMSYGVTPLCTAVGGIPTHIKHDINGLLVASTNEGEIVTSFVEIIQQLVSDPARVERLSQSVYSYAQQHFAGERFCVSYRNLILKALADSVGQQV